MKPIKKLLCLLHHYAAWPQGIALLAVRFYLAKVFFFAGLNKINSWSSTIALFSDEYQVPLLPPEIAAYLATAAELTFPALLVLGLLTPLAALGLMGMTLVIELFVYPGTTEHYYWLLLAGVLLTQGGGKFSVDHYLQKFIMQK
jgi:putative oxidoreductase